MASKAKETVIDHRSVRVLCHGCKTNWHVTARLYAESSGKVDCGKCTASLDIPAHEVAPAPLRWTVLAKYKPGAIIPSGPKTSNVICGKCGYFGLLSAAKWEEERGFVKCESCSAPMDIELRQLGLDPKKDVQLPVEKLVSAPPPRHPDAGPEEGASALGATVTLKQIIPAALKDDPSIYHHPHPPVAAAKVSKRALMAANEGPTRGHLDRHMTLVPSRSPSPSPGPAHPEAAPHPESALTAGRVQT